MTHAQEPDIIKGSNPEGTFQRAIVEEIKRIIERKKSERAIIDYFIQENFGLDVAVFIKWSKISFALRFFELKAFVGSRQGGVGFGNQSGGGPQVDLLMLTDQKLSLADEFVRWILVYGTLPKGTNRYVIFDNKQAKNAAMAGVGRSKQNNLRVNKLMENAIAWNELLEEIESFLLS